MSSASLLGLAAWVVAGCAAVTDWWAVRHPPAPSVETVAKPLVMVGLATVVISGAGAGTDQPSTLRAWLLVALLFGLIGDVLLLPAIDHFIGGLASFLVGHIGYIGAAAVVGIGSGPWLAVGAVAAAVGLITVGRPILGRLAGSRLQPPVALYIGVIAAALILIGGTGRPLALAGAVLFAASDGLLGWTRFVDRRTDLRWLVHVGYHLGQALIVAGLIGPDLF